MLRTRPCFTLYFLLLSVTAAEFSVVGHGPVQASAGEDVVLPCHLEPPFDVSNLTVEWTRNGHTVHFYRNRDDNYEDQDQQFRGRTSLFHHGMTTGNLSLKLTKVTEEDSGVYICFVPGLDSQVKRGNVLLTVGSPDVVGHRTVQVTEGEDVVLPCHLEPPFDVSDLTVEWTWDGHTVHVYTNGGDNYDDQLQQFRDRTSLFPEEMIRGNISLKLFNVTEEDSGLYICYIPRLENQVKRGNILLRVNPWNDAGGREETGGNYETEDDQRGAIVGGVVVAVILLVLLVLGWKYEDRLETWRNGRRRTEKNLGNHRWEHEQIYLEPVP